MKNKKLLIYLYVILILSVLFMCTGFVQAGPKDIKEINVVMDNNYPPYSFLGSEGQLQGITIDQWKLFEKKTGIHVRITAEVWSKAFKDMSEGKYDVIDTISYNEEREKTFDYTEPYATIEVPIFFQKNISGITDAASLRGFTVAAKKGDNAVRVLKENGINDIVEYPSAEDLITAAKEQKLVIFVMGKPPAEYYLYKLQIQDKFNYSTSLYTSKFYRAVKEGNNELLGILNNGFSMISPAEYKAIDDKWFGNTNLPANDRKLFQVIIVIAILVVLVAFFLYLWNSALRESVAVKTEELSRFLEELRDSEYTFRALFERSSDFILILDFDKIIDCNKASIELFGYESKDSLIGKSPWELSPMFQEKNVTSKEKFYFLLNDVENKTKTKFEWFHQKKDGTLVTVEIVLTRILLKGKAVSHILMRDISDRKLMENKLEYISYHDQLTELYNRRFFEEELKRMDVPRNYPLTIVMADVNGLKLVNDSFGHNFGDELLKKVGSIITGGCRADDVIARLGGDEFVVLLPKTDSYEAEQIINRMKNKAMEERIGSVSISVSFGWETKEAPEELISEVLKKAEDYMYKEKLFESPSMRGKTINAILSTLHEKNKREEQHSHRVSAICVELGRALGMVEGELKELRTVGLLHDIGKIAIEENILNKPGKLDEHEWEEIKRHPEIGYRILSTVNDMAEMAEYVLAHHERWDGTGYPKGLRGEEIPLVSRIIAIADTFDAITSSRSYRNAASREYAIKELMDHRGTQFEPMLVELFVQNVVGRIQENDYYEKLYNKKN